MQKGKLKRATFPSFWHLLDRDFFPRILLSLFFRSHAFPVPRQQENDAGPISKTTNSFAPPFSISMIQKFDGANNGEADHRSVSSGDLRHQHEFELPGF